MAAIAATSISGFMKRPPPFNVSFTRPAPDAVCWPNDARCEEGGTQNLFQVFNHADERIAAALFDKALCVQTHHRPADRVAFVAAYAERETALVILADLDHDDRMRHVMGVSLRKGKIEGVPAAIVLDDVAHGGGLNANVKALEDAGSVRRILYGLVHEYRMSHGKLELVSGRTEP